ncbi:major capsid protein P2 [Gynuella sunshinyii]|uniref:Uncharacterized protein n=1 Tax=Gynuella sunshinyii YC6258 TaxID=1445510 RepID=A0A0C5VCP8_9GAMM|nr:major capsid protein P2 [Gynuella sunshinyii]AJQ92242.1 hypothetical Protein YC6258_00190 [Gynuella sunshinyii YC6258]AJQ95811.1 hypothetical Protein YC6258_03775 [Gynuella sunshinyii YC6258]
MRPLRKLDSFSGVAPGETATMRIQPGPRYDDIIIKTNLSPDKIESVSLVLNTEDMFGGGLSGKELHMLSKYIKIEVGSSGPTYFYRLPLSMKGAVLRDSMLSTGLPTGGTDDIILKVKIAESAQAPTLKALARTSPNPGRRNFIRSFKRYYVPAAAAGKVEFTTMNKGPRLLTAHCKATGIKGIEVEADHVKIYEALADEQVFILKDGQFPRVPQTGYYHFDPVAEGYPILDSMPTTANSLVFRFDVSQGNQQIEMLCEVLEPKVAVWTSSEAPATSKTRSSRSVGRR